MTGEAKIKRVSIHITGRVQGVFYRVRAREYADSIGVSGFVRNEPGGLVYIEAEAEEEALDRFVEWCREGSPYADVSDVRSEEMEPKGGSGFSIIY